MIMVDCIVTMKKVDILHNFYEINMYHGVASTYVWHTWILAFGLSIPLNKKMPKNENKKEDVTVDSGSEYLSKMSISVIS